MLGLKNTALDYYWSHVSKEKLDIIRNQIYPLGKRNISIEWKSIET